MAKGEKKMGNKAKYNDGRTFNGDEGYKWLRAEPATKYFNMGRNVLDKVAINADAKKKVAPRVVLYDVERIERYLKTL
jgi:hypothetical protein